MSLAVCFQNHDELIIAADTALTREINGEFFRVKTPVRKLFHIGQFLMFMSGSAAVVSLVVHRFQKAKEKNIYVLQELVTQACKEYSAMNVNQDESEGNVAVMAAEYTAKGTIVYTIQPDSGFQVFSYQTSASSTRPHTGGISANEALKKVSTRLNEGCTIHDIIKEVFNDLSGEQIGGYLMMAKLDKNGISFANMQKIDEVVKLKYYEENLPTDHMTGSLVQTSEEGSYPRAEMSSTEKMFKVESSSSATIEVRSIGYPNSIPDIYFSTGSANASISLPSETAGLFMNGRKLTLEFDDILIRGYNQVSVLDWNNFRSEGANRSLQEELNDTAYNMTFDPATRNLKLWSRSGNLLAQVNIPDQT